MRLPAPHALHALPFAPLPSRSGRAAAPASAAIVPATTQIFACAGPANQAERLRYEWDHFFDLCDAEVARFRALMKDLGGPEPQRTAAIDAAARWLEANANTDLGGSCSVSYTGTTLTSLTCKNGPNGPPTVLF